MLKKIVAAAAVFACLAGPASAQHYLQWGNVSPWGLEMVDPFGNLHYVNPYAYDSQVDVYGNVISNFGAPLGGTPGFYQLTPTPNPSLDFSWSTPSMSSPGLGDPTSMFPELH